MWVNNLNPVLLDLGILEIRWYGFMYFISAIIILYLFKKYNKKDFFTTDVENLIIYTLISMILGSRIFYYLVYNFKLFLKNPIYIIDLRYGGFSFHGALIGIIIGLLIFSSLDFKKYKKLTTKTKKSKIKKKDQASNVELKKLSDNIEDVKNSKEYFLRIADYLSLFIPIGLFLGRIGNFINSELYGRITTNTFFGVIFKGQSVLRHPSQLYESFFEGLILFIILYFFYNKFYLKNRFTSNHKIKRGSIFILFLVLYSLFRFFIEFFREPDTQIGFLNFLGFSVSLGQILSIITFLSGIILYYILNKK